MIFPQRKELQLVPCGWDGGFFEATETTETQRRDGMKVRMLWQRLRSDPRRDHGRGNIIRLFGDVRHPLFTRGPSYTPPSHHYHLPFPLPFSLHLLSPIPLSLTLPPSPSLCLPLSLPLLSPLTPSFPLPLPSYSPPLSRISFPPPPFAPTPLPSPWTTPRSHTCETIQAKFIVCK